MKLITLFFLGALSACQASNDNDLDQEKVNWQTDHDSAMSASAKTGKPVFVLFEGKASSGKELKKEVLKHPLFIESIGTDFIPLLVKSSQSGATKELLAKYKVSSEKLPVVAFLNSEGKDVIPRKDAKITAAQLFPRMQSALVKSSQTSAILPLIAPELATSSSIALSQHCFWTGELVIGSIDGIIRTEAGWLGGKEVTLVHFDSKIVSEKEVISQAKAQSCANNVYRGKELKGYRTARESDQKRQLQGTRFDKIKNLTAHQRTKVNAFARTQPLEALRYLTPSQKKAL